MNKTLMDGGAVVVVYEIPTHRVPGNAVKIIGCSIACALGLALPADIPAQGFGNEWVEFELDNSRLVADPAVGVDDIEEKDYAFGDFDKDGRIDLVSVRKEPVHTTGRRTNVLFMNENGVLTDRTLEYASASTVAGDQGFLTPTNDRDVVVTDVDQDSWPDLVTATTLSPLTPKHVSHPRVYMNLGEDTEGNWLGFRYEEIRIPQLLLSGGTPSWPRFTAIDAGDVTGDGYPDLYFGDNDDAPQFGGGDMNDRLLVNDTTGHFVDESALRMTSEMLSATYTTSVTVADVNLDDKLDIVRERGLLLPTSIAYNDPKGEGFFNLLDDVYGGFGYYATLGDLNQDEFLDAVISDNAADRYLYGTEMDGSGTAQWGPPKSFQFLTGSDDGFASDSYIVDLDGDGWNDVVITDFDVQIPGCGRRTHVYHNPGGSVGESITLVEEAEQAGGGWRGAVGLFPAGLQGTHDAAIFDIDGDTRPDMVLGRCSGTDVFINVAPQAGGTIIPSGGPGASPLTVRLVPGGNLRLSWGGSCAVGDEDFGVYSGPLDDPSSMAPLLCSTSGMTSATLSAPNGNVFFLVVPTDGVVEGSYGVDGAGLERAAASSACHPQSITDCE